MRLVHRCTQSTVELYVLYTCHLIFTKKKNTISKHFETNFFFRYWFNWYFTVLNLNMIKIIFFIFFTYVRKIYSSLLSRIANQPKEEVMIDVRTIKFMEDMRYSSEIQTGIFYTRSSYILLIYLFICTANNNWLCTLLKPWSLFLF